MEPAAFETPAGVPVTAMTAAEMRDVDRVAVDPDRIVTLALPKTGLVNRADPLVLADIAIPRAVYERVDVEYDRPFGRDSWTERLR